jgi:hypothetical protein
MTHSKIHFLDHFTFKCAAEIVLAIIGNKLNRITMLCGALLARNK